MWWPLTRVRRPAQDTRAVLLPSNKADTEANLSLEEKLRRERQRRLAVGITEYWWCVRA